MLPVSSAYFELRICASSPVACRPVHASLSTALAASGRSLSSAAAPVSPTASAAKNSSAAGSGPLGRGVQAPSVTTSAATVDKAAMRVADENSAAIEADV